MSASVALGLVLAVVCAVIGLVGFFFKLRGAAESPAVQWRRPVRSTLELFRHKWWTIGILVAMGGWVFHVAALALAPISLVQATIAGGLVLLTPMADRVFGISVTKRDWIGVAIAAAGLALLAGTLGDGAESAHDQFEAATLALYAGGLAAGALLCVLLTLGDRGHAGPVLAIGAGFLWGASDVVIKAKAGDLADEWLLVLLSYEALAITVLSLVGLTVSARSLQLGPPVAVIAITAASGNVVTIAAGPIVFGEPLPDGTGALLLRLLAFAAVIAGAALTPGPKPEPEAAPPLVGSRPEPEPARV